MAESYTQFLNIPIDFIKLINFPGIVFAPDSSVLWRAPEVSLFIQETEPNEIHRLALNSIVPSNGMGTFSIDTPDGEVRVAVFTMSADPDTKSAEHPPGIAVFFRYTSGGTLESVNQTLLTAKQMAEEASEAKSRFMANVSHEVRTPLSGIIGFTELLLETNPRDDQKEYLEILKESSFALMTIVNEILDLSKIEAGRMDLRADWFDLRAAVYSVKDLFSLLASKKGLTFSVSIEETVPGSLFGDADRIGQILKNLISNAIKYTAKGTVTVTATSRSLADDTVLVEISVADTGHGIPTEKMKDLFTPFATLESTSQGRKEGIGLGLSISKTLAELMNGSISVRSSVGGGSEFILGVPFSLSGETLPNNDPADLSILPLSFNILLGEDNRANRTFISHYLRSKGHTVVTAENGVDVLRALDKQQFDILILDIQMPILDGPSTLREIRSSGQEYANIPTLALTAYTMKGDREQILNFGMDGYVAKPVDLKLLENSIATLIKRGSKISPDEFSQSGMDVGSLSDRYKGETAVLAEILRIFVEETPAKLTTLKVATESDYQQVLEILHSLVNTSAVVRAELLFHESRTQEMNLRDSGRVGDASRFDKLISHANGALSKARAMIVNLEEH